jgi:hypothetical protein
MPITTRQMATDIAKVPEFAYGDGTVNISYAPSRITEATLETIQSLDSNDQRPLSEYTHIMNGVIIELVTDWDVYEDDAQTVKTPIDDAHLRELPVFFRAAILNRIMEAFSPNETGATTTNVQSSPTIPTSATEPPLAAS